jgi:aspartyl-tRNA(Asn)/glutamyl-tRNA(Gln) amidotransferase subunit A
VNRRGGNDVTFDPATMTIADARRAIGQRQLSALELTEAVLARAEPQDARLRSYLHLDADGATAQAREIDRTRDERPLAGIPICVKDVIDVAGMPTTAGSARWRRFATADALSVARLRAAGAVIVGKGHTNEFAYGIDGKNPHFWDLANPYDTTRISGGSSSGPAVATATGACLAGLGTDTSGSIRVPASFCGLAGLRPTTGSVPTDGVVPLAWSYDTVGPLTRTVADAAVVFDVIAGSPGTAGADLHGSVRGRRIGVVEQLTESVEPYVEAAVWSCARELEAGGAEVIPVRFDRLRFVNAMHQLIQHAEASAAHATWFDAQYEHYGKPVRLRLAAGRRLPSAAYLAAQRARRLLIEEVAATMRGLDALLAPSAPCVAPPSDADTLVVRGERVDLRAALLHCAMAASQLACPVVAVPIGTYEGLPFGMQIIGRPFSEHVLLSIAGVCEAIAVTGAL